MSDDKIIMNDLQGLPRRLRNKIDMHPIKMRDALDFYDSVSVLNIDKNSIDDANILQMSYLKFLLQFSYYDAYKNLLDKLIKLLQLIFRTEDVDLGVKVKVEKVVPKDDSDTEFKTILEDTFLSLKEQPDACFIENVKCFVLVDGKIELSEFDFSKIKGIIGEQNMVEMNDDKYKSKEYKEAMERARKYMAKKNGKQAPLDQRILAYQYEMKIDDINKVLDMTLYQFNRSLETIVHIKYSDTLQHALYSGMVSVKDNTKIPHWLTAIEREKEDPLKIDADTFTSEITKTLGI